MAVSAYQTVQAKGLREDLTEVISRIDPTEVPFYSNIGEGSAKAKYHEWQVQKLAAPDTNNARLEGANASNTALTPTVRVGNRTQISDKVAEVSGTLQAVDKAGREDEMAYQVTLKGLELKRDMEAIMVGAQAAQVGDEQTIPSRLGGFESWLVSNVNRGVGGANGGFANGIVAAPVDGTLRPFAESQLKAVMQSCFASGGRPTTIMMGASLKQTFSSFTGLAANRIDNSPGSGQLTIIGAADVYVSDFGKLTAVPNLFMRARSVLLLDSKKARKAWLRKIKRWPLAKQGDSTREQVLAEYTLQVENEAAHGIIADVQ